MDRYLTSSSTSDVICSLICLTISFVCAKISLSHGYSLFFILVFRLEWTLHFRSTVLWTILQNLPFNENIPFLLYVSMRSFPIFRRTAVYCLVCVSLCSCTRMFIVRKNYFTYTHNVDAFKHAFILPSMCP